MPEARVRGGTKLGVRERRARTESVQQGERKQCEAEMRSSSGWLVGGDARRILIPSAFAARIAHSGQSCTQRESAGIALATAGQRSTVERMPGRLGIKRGQRCFAWSGAALVTGMWACGASPKHTESVQEASAGEPHARSESQATELPESLAVPAGQQLGFQADAKGVQIYECQVSSSGESKWALSAPEAELFDAAGNLAGKHYAGPTWESVDGSRVAAKKESEHHQDPGAIPWLLLRATEHQGQGSLAPVTFIVRKNTSGGLPPPEGCDAAHGGDTARVPYTAVYVFYVSS